ncbi:MAG TPA: hypothetical protein VK171_03990 [Fimbriimonas sp.]|nr:hypothetical protein [Fimbriimonas sp.]
MNVISLITAFVALQGGAAKKPTLNLDVFRMVGTQRVAVKTGESITGEIHFRVVLQTETPIQAVEFYLGDDLRESDGSTPYEFKVDTIGEEDGEYKFRFKGFTTEGQNAEKVYSLKIDNGVSKGAAYHVERGNEFIAEGKFDDAITAGRIAQKADRDFNPARILLAQANFRKGFYDKAQKFAEDALTADKKSKVAKDILISLKINQAFNAVSRSADDRKEVIKTIKNALSSAIVLRKEQQDDEVAAVSGDKTSLEYLDAAIRARRYTLVVDALADRLTSEFKNNDHNNRLLFAYLMTSQITKADQLLTNIKKFGELDGYGYALAAVLGAEYGNDNQSDSMIKEALLNAPDSLGLSTAQAFIALKRDQQKALLDAAKALLSGSEVRSESYYFAAALSNKQNQINQGRKYFELALKADVADHDMYVEMGNEAILLAQNPAVTGKDNEFQLEYARAMYDLALACRDNSGQALAGVALAAMYQKDYAAAQSYAEAATKAAPNYAAGWYVYAGALAIRQQDGRAALQKAQMLDAKNLAGRTMPTQDVAFKYFNSAGRTPVISPPVRG